MTAAEPAAEQTGYIGGIVVIAGSQAPAAGAEVILGVSRGGEFIPSAKTVADGNGKFLFGGLRAAPAVAYKPGANWEGVHYPGPAIRLAPGRTTVGVKLIVNRAVAEPNLLLAQKHEIVLRPKRGALEVSETIVVENPTSDCYVGKPAEEGGQPETLCLRIPSDFERVTFDDEFYGRRFAVSDGRLVTGVPWTPGRQVLRFTYAMRNDQQRLAWTRPLDLPCADVTVEIVTDQPQEVSCSLQGERREEPGKVVYRHSGSELAATHKIRVELGRLTVSRLAYGKWIAAGLLAALILLAATGRIRQRLREGAASEQRSISGIAPVGLKRRKTAGRIG